MKKKAWCKILRQTIKDEDRAAKNARKMKKYAKCSCVKGKLQYAATNNVKSNKKMREVYRQVCQSKR